MKSFTIHRWVLITSLFFIFVLPLLAFAQVDYKSGLVPCGAVPFDISNIGPSVFNATSCNFCYLAKLIQNILNFLITLTIPISVGMFAWAGIKYFTSAADPKGVATAKKIFISTFWGFVLALSGWLIVQVVLQSITNGNFYNATNWTSLNCGDPKYNSEQARPRSQNISSILGSIQVAVPANVPQGTGPGGVVGTVDSNSVARATGNADLSIACANNSMGADCSLLQSVCIAESNCNSQLSGCNSVGACGPMQIKPATACDANPGISGCSTGNMTQVAAALNDMQTAADTAAKVLNKGSTTCNGDLTCMMGYYNGGPGAVRSSACCSTGMAYQCQWDCGSTITGYAQCDVSQTSICVQNRGYVETRNYVTQVQASQNTIRANVNPYNPAAH